MKIQVLISVLISVCHCLKLAQKCDRSGNNLMFILEMDLEGSTYEYATFKDSGGVELRNTCGTEGGQFTGSGTAADPLTVVVRINATVDINTGAPDCGHTTEGEVLTWTLFIVYTIPTIPFAIGKQVEKPISCDYANISQTVSVGIQANTSSEMFVQDLKTVILHHSSLALEMSVVKESFAEYGSSEVYKLADNVRLRIRAVNNITGLYGYNCKACNTALCDDVIFAMLDSNGCKYSDFTDILGSSSASEQPTYTGTFMMGHLTIQGFDLSVYAGMAFTEEFSLFRFVGSNDVYFTCSIGYCPDPADPECTRHCSYATNRTRGQRDVSWLDEEEAADHTIVAIRVVGDDQNLLLDHPNQLVYNPSQNSSPAPEISCLESPQYLGIIAGMGSLFLVSCIGIIVIGSKVIKSKR